MARVYVDDNPYSQAYLQTWRKEAKFPELKAFWKAAQIDENGFLWLEDSGTEFTPEERLFRVVSPDGEYLGECVFPPGEGRIERGQYLLIDTDWLSGRQNLIVYTIVPNVGGLDYSTLPGS